MPPSKTRSTNGTKPRTRAVPKADVVRRTAAHPSQNQPSQAEIARIRSTPMPEPLHLYSDDAPDEVEVQPLFYLDDEEYCIPVEFPTNVALQYLRQARVNGENVALGWLLEEILGEDAYAALMNYRGLRPEHLDHINTVVGQLALGSLDTPKGRSATG